MEFKRLLVVLQIIIVKLGIRLFNIRGKISIQLITSKKKLQVLTLAFYPFDIIDLYIPHIALDKYIFRFQKVEKCM